MKELSSNLIKKLKKALSVVSARHQLQQQAQKQFQAHILTMILSKNNLSDIEFLTKQQFKIYNLEIKNENYQKN